MKEYYCDLCKYETKSSSSWCIHKKTKKHLLLQNNINLKNSEGQNDYVNENIHLKDKLINLENQSETIIQMLKKQIAELQEDKKKLEEDKNRQIDKLEKDKNMLMKKLEVQNEQFIKELHLDKKELKDKLEIEQNYSKQVINNAGTIVGKSISTLQFITQNYNTAPILTQLPDYSNISENDQKLIDNLIYYQKKGTLHEYIGNYIIQNYKKDNPKNQSMWNTDTDRLNYVIRELFIKNVKKNDKIIIEEIDESNETLEWVIDKKGNKVCKHIIEPILSYIKIKCTEFINKNNDYYNISIKDTSNNYKKLEILAEINTSIINNNLLKNINKYISSHFYLNKNVLSLK